MHDFFRRFAQRTSVIVGSPTSFIAAFLLIVIWLVTGPIFDFSDTWQLVINTTTTIITFLMVFLIQNTQNRDTKAINLKLDEVIFHMKSARNKLIDIEDMDDDEIEKYQKQFEDIRKNRQSKVSTVAKK